MVLPGPWKHIVNISKGLKELGLDLENGFRREVKEGNNTLFWIDHWCGDSSFHVRFPLLFQLETQKWCSVSDRLIMHDGEICGQWVWFRVPTCQVEIEELRGLLLACQPVRLVSGVDRFVRSFDEEKFFSVKSFKAKMEAIVGSDIGYLIEWNNFVPKKVGILAWRAEIERIPVLMALTKRNVNLESIWCPVCGDAEETAEHLLGSCRFAQALWNGIANWCKVPVIYAFSTRDVLELYKYCHFSKQKAKIFQAVCLTTVWCIWKARNAAVFERKPVNRCNLIGEIRVRSFLWVRNRSKNTRISWEKWRRFDIENI
ncbi:uncharacterized protein LOC143571311 [Bidens hawaiensis]|uniref:uncharacterized protein LOC143542784 n=1 Tax=Bidens hawaiensis TaxID=980011 RepID=UPI004049CEF6